MTEKELLSGLLSKTLNMDETAVASLYNEDGSLKDDSLQVVTTIDADRVKRLKTDETEIFNKARWSAKGEVMKNLEKEFVEKTSFKSDKKGIELFLEYATEKAKEAGSQVTEDVIKKHPLFISTIDNLNTKHEQVIQEKQSEFEKFKSELADNDTFGKISKKALGLFHSLKPILPKDPIKSKAQEELFLERLSGYKYEIQGDTEVVLDKERKVLEDAHGNRLKLDKIVQEIAHKYYEFHATDPKSSPNNGKESSANGSASVRVPKSEKEYAEFMADSSIPVDERLAAKDAYSKQQGKN